MSDTTTSAAGQPEQAATEAKRKFTPHDIKLSVKTGKAEALDQHMRVKKQDFIVVTVNNKSDHDINNFGVGYTTGNPRLLFKRSEARLDLDSPNGEPPNTLRAGETRTITMGRNKAEKYRIGTSISGIPADGKPFYQKRSPNTITSLYKKIMFGAKAFVAGTAVLVGVAAYHGMFPEKSDSQKTPATGSAHHRTDATTRAQLATNYTIKTMEGECALPAGTPLKVGSAVPENIQKNYKEARTYVTVPAVPAECKGVVKSGHKLALPNTVIEQKVTAPQANATQSPQRPKLASTQHAIKYTAS